MLVSANRSLVDCDIKKHPEIQEMYDGLRLLEPMVTKDITNITEDSGGYLKGLENSVKTASSIDDKLERMSRKSPLPTAENFRRMGDILRYTQICEHNDIIPTVKKTMKSLEEKGYMVRELKNYYKHPFMGTGYKGIHLSVISPQGITFELQIHSERSFAAKQKGHSLYETIRAVATPIQQKKEAQKEILRIHGSVPDPPGYDQLKTFSVSEKEISEFLHGIKPLDISIERSEDGNTLSYNMRQGGNDLVHGAEIHFSDGSCMSFRSAEKSGEIQCVSISKEAECVFHSTLELDRDACRISLEEAEHLKSAMEKSSAIWFRENIEFPETPNRVPGLAEKAGTPGKILSGIRNHDPYLLALTGQNITAEIAQNVPHRTDIERER